MGLYLELKADFTVKQHAETTTRGIGETVQVMTSAEGTTGTCTTACRRRNLHAGLYFVVIQIHSKPSSRCSCSYPSSCPCSCFYSYYSVASSSSFFNSYSYCYYYCYYHYYHYHYYHYYYYYCCYYY